MEDNDKLLNAFFEDNRQDIPDNSFSEKVMYRLPKVLARRNRIWRFCCLMAAIAIFLIFDGIADLQIIVSKLFENIVANNSLYQYSLSRLLLLYGLILSLSGFAVFKVAMKE